MNRIRMTPRFIMSLAVAVAAASSGCVVDARDVADPVTSTGAYESVPPPTCGDTYAPGCGGSCATATDICAPTAVGGVCACRAPVCTKAVAAALPNGSCPSGYAWGRTVTVCRGRVVSNIRQCEKAQGDTCCMLKVQTTTLGSCSASTTVPSC